MTTTEHADLIERLESLSTPGSSFDPPAMLDAMRSALTALRTSYRDGWLGAASALESETPASGGPGEAIARAAVGYLRRNAPQEGE